MKKDTLFPQDDQAISLIRRKTGERVKHATFTNQKASIMTICLVLTLSIIIFIWGIFSNHVQWYTYTIYIIIFFQTSTLLFNQFAITEKGIINGSRVIPWRHIKSFEFSRIDIDDFNYYTFKHELREAYELRIEMRLFSTKLIVVNEQTKKEFERLLVQHMQKELPMDNQQVE